MINPDIDRLTNFVIRFTEEDVLAQVEALTRVN